MVNGSFQCNALAKEISTNWYYRLALICQVAAAATAIISTLFLIPRMRKHKFFHKSTKLLLYLELSFAAVHATGVVSVLSHHVMSSFLFDDNCELTYRSGRCAFVYIPMMCCVTGIILCQNALWIERFCATFCFTAYSRTRNAFVGWILVACVMVAVVVANTSVFYGEPYTEGVITCLAAPSHLGPKISLIFDVFIVLNCVAVAANMLLYLGNKQIDSRIRYFVNLRCHANENLITTMWVGRIGFVQCLLLAIYSVGISTVKRIYSNATGTQMLVLIVWLYTVPYLTCILPIMTAVALKDIRRKRGEKIRALTSVREDSANHVKSLQDSWDAMFKQSNRQ